MTHGQVRGGANIAFVGHISRVAWTGFYAGQCCNKIEKAAFEVCSGTNNMIMYIMSLARA